MRRLLLVSVFMTICATSTPAQSDDIRRWEGYVGFSYLRSESRDVNDPIIATALEGKEDFKGFNASFTYNFSRYLGGLFDFGYAKRDDDFVSSFPVPPFNVIGEVHQKYSSYMGGIQFKDNTRNGARLKPFGHALAGGTTQRFTIESTDLLLVGFPDDDVTVNQTSFSMALGGGLDIRLTEHIDLRAIKVEWVPVFTGDRTVFGVTFEGRTIHQFRFGIGIAFH